VEKRADLCKGVLKGKIGLEPDKNNFGGKNEKNYKNTYRIGNYPACACRMH
jgi:hypothetical protein